MSEDHHAVECGLAAAGAIALGAYIGLTWGAGALVVALTFTAYAVCAGVSAARAWRAI